MGGRGYPGRLSTIYKLADKKLHRPNIWIYICVIRSPFTLYFIGKQTLFFFRLERQMHDYLLFPFRDV